MAIWWRGGRKEEKDYSSSLSNKMGTGNSRENSEVANASASSLSLSRQENDEISNSRENSGVANDEISKLRELNKRLVNEVACLRQEKASLFSDETNMEATVFLLKDKKIKLESELTESMSSTMDLPEETEDIHSRYSETRKWEGIATEPQTQLDLVSSERELLSQKNREIAQLNILQSEFSKSKKRIRDLLQNQQHLWDKDKRNMEDKIDQLQEKVNEAVEQHLYLIKQYKATEDALRQQNKMLQEQVDSNRYLLETQNKKIEQSIIENGRLNKQVEELSKKFEEVYNTHIKQVGDDKEQRTEYGELVERHFELLKDNEEQGNMIESLQRETASVVSKRSVLLHEAAKSSEEVSEKCSKSDQSQLWRLHTEMVAVNSKLKQPLQEKSTVIQNGKEMNPSLAEAKSKLKQRLQEKSAVIQNREEMNPVLAEMRWKLRKPLQVKSPGIKGKENNPALTELKSKLKRPSTDNGEDNIKTRI